MYVCVSITGLQLKYTSLLLNHAGIMNAFLMELKDWEDRRQWQENEFRDTYRRRLTAQQWDERQQEMSCVPASE